jgi:hypothetical protein
VEWWPSNYSPHARAAARSAARNTVFAIFITVLLRVDWTRLRESLGNGGGKGVIRASFSRQGFVKAKALILRSECRTVKVPIDPLDQPRGRYSFMKFRAEGRTRSECPSCGTQSTARHSRYWRQLQDLPVQGRLRTFTSPIDANISWLPLHRD